MNQDVEALRRKVFLEDIASRMAAGDSVRKVARERNQRPDALKQLVKSDEFLAVLDGYDKDLADDIRAERDAARPQAYEELILDEAQKSVQRLADIRDMSENENASVAASKAIVDIAEKIKKVHTEKTTRRITFPQRQLDTLLEVTAELDESPDFADAEPSTGGVPTQGVV